MSRLRIIEAGLELSDEIDEEDDEEALAQFRQERALRREADELRKYIASLDAIIGKPAPRINKPRVGTLSDGVTAIDTARIAANKISESSQGKSAGYRRRFIDMFGDASIREIKRADVDRWIDAVAGLPNVNYLPPKERQASLSALLDMRADLDVPAVDSVVPQRHLDWLRSVLNYGVQKAIIEANVAAGIKVPASSRAYADRRQPFSPTQLREVLNVAERVWKDDTRLWYLRLAVYSGARPDELAQLKYDDFRSEDGIPFADIHDLDGRTIKNASSVRKVPLHPQLISAGILDFIEKRKGKAGDNVWGFERQTQGYHSYATRAFRSNILKLCDSVQRNGEPDKRLVWYGLRHSFADACRNGGVRDDARRALMGHVEQGAAGGYGAGFGLRVLADEIAKADPLKS